ncbi:dTMP kinase [Candidatus Kaiserbacteria bacterium]|nr:dTMP kinase [Candidatus Kaiserbacteria bacterium]
MKGNRFIVIDGLGGSGKTTQIELLKKRLPDAVFTHEPGGAPRAEKIRAILKEGDGAKLDPLTDFFLFWAARAEHMTALIRPALEEGKTVVSDRFDSSTFAMQVRGDEQPNLSDFFWQCREATLGDAKPNCYIVLDIDPGKAHTRRDSRHRLPGEDRFDERNDAYQERVRQGYKEFAAKVGGHVIDASRTPKEIDVDMWKIIQPLI